MAPPWWPPIVIPLLALLCVAVGEKAIAVTRPFAVVDAPSLAASFDIWDTYLPCDGVGTHGYVYDLHLYFSQNLFDYPDIEVQSQAVLDGFLAKTHAWHACFRQVSMFSAGLTAEEDVYTNAAGGDSGPNAIGPNLQFAKMYQAYSSLSVGNYETFYLMEMDTLPRRNFWLDTLCALHASAMPYGVLGATYSGDKWRDFEPSLDQSLQLHINGNAFYNPRHMLLVEMGELCTLKGEGIG